MKNRTVLIFSPKPRSFVELVQLVEAIGRRISVKTEKKINEIEIDSKYVGYVTKVLSIHGYNVVDRRLHEAKKSKLLGAIELLGEKYLDDRPRVVKKPPSLHKRKVMDFVNRKAREARRARTKTRIQHKRDKLDGKIAALDDIVRYLKKKN